MERRLEPELMDDPALPVERHRRALRGLERINAWTRSTRAVWAPIRKLARSRQPLRVLDLACGAGDVAIGLAALAAREGLPVQVDGCDLSPVAIDHARERAAQRGVTVGFSQINVLTEPLPTSYDVITASLFLHHLARQDAVGVLARMSRAARRMVVVSDLRRSRLGLLVAELGTRLLTREAVVHVDGPRSVWAAYTPAELSEMAREAGLGDASVKCFAPCRMLLAWSRV